MRLSSNPNILRLVVCARHAQLRVSMVHQRGSAAPLPCSVSIQTKYSRGWAFLQRSWRHYAQLEQSRNGRPDWAQETAVRTAHAPCWYPNVIWFASVSKQQPQKQKANHAEEKEQQGAAH